MDEWWHLHLMDFGGRVRRKVEFMVAETYIWVFGLQSEESRVTTSTKRDDLSGMFPS